MPTFEYDRRYVEHGIEMLESYLLADAIYWPMRVQPPPGEPAYPMLTLEGLLLSMHRLQAYRDRLSLINQATKLGLDLEMLHTHWRAAWEKKADRAYRARLKMWRDFLAEYSINAEAHADRYIYEVRLRVFLSLLSRETGKAETEFIALLTKLDQFLEAVLIPGEFIWGDEIQSGFPINEYWYLYGNLPNYLLEHAHRIGEIPDG